MRSLSLDMHQTWWTLWSHWRTQRGRPRHVRSTSRCLGWQAMAHDLPWAAVLGAAPWTFPMAAVRHSAHCGKLGLRLEDAPWCLEKHGMMETVKYGLLFFSKIFMQAMEVIDHHTIIIHLCSFAHQRYHENIWKSWNILARRAAISGLPLPQDISDGVMQQSLVQRVEHWELRSRLSADGSQSYPPRSTLMNSARFTRGYSQNLPTKSEVIWDFISGWRDPTCCICPNGPGLRKLHGCPTRWPPWKIEAHVRHLK